MSTNRETPDHNENDSDPSRSEGLKAWFKRHKTKLILGAVAASAVLTFTNNPVSELKEDVEEAAPWVVGGVAASEALFVIGGAMMVGAVGEKIGLNPLKIRERVPEIANKANNSVLFKTGFAVNATGAVGDFVVISAGVITEMPPESYPLLGLTLLDLAGTIAVRKAILDGINENSISEEHLTVNLDEPGENYE